MNASLLAAPRAFTTGPFEFALLTPYGFWFCGCPHRPRRVVCLGMASITSRARRI